MGVEGGEAVVDERVCYLGIQKPDRCQYGRECIQKRSGKRCNPCFCMPRGERCCRRKAMLLAPLTCE